MSPALLHLNFKARALVQRLNPQSISSRNVLKLIGGTAGSQVIAVAAAPILTRLYGPESFGVVATFTSILALITVVSSLRFELAIGLPQDDHESVALVWLCFGLVAISTGLTAFGVLLLGDILVVCLNQLALQPLLWLLPMGVLLNGLYQPLSYWAIRHKQFGLLAQTRLSQSIFGVATNLVAAPLGTIGLLFGQIVGQSSVLVAILSQSAGHLFRHRPSAGVIGRIIFRYSKFPLYSSPAGLINLAGSQLPIIILASHYGTKPVGELALSQKLLLLPAGLIGSSISQVFLQRASDSYSSGSLGTLVSSVSRRLVSYGVALSIPVALFAPKLMPFVFGSEWSQSGVITVILIPLFIGQVSVSPVSVAFIACRRNDLELLSQLLQVLFMIVPTLILAVLGFGFEWALAGYSIGSLVGYLVYYLLLKRALQY